MRLLAINSYDKDLYVERWIEQSRALDPKVWECQVTSNGPSGRIFPVRTIRCDNPSVILGYRSALLATDVRPHIDAIVSVHAKTWIPDFRLMDRMVGLLVEHDIVLVKWPIFWEIGGGECLFLMAVRPDAWRRIMERIPGHDPEIWNEVMLTRIIAELGLDAMRLPCTLRLAEDNVSHLVQDIGGWGLDFYGGEPNERIGFGHYKEPGGYRPVRVDCYGVVHDRPKG